MGVGGLTFKVQHVPECEAETKPHLHFFSSISENHIFFVQCRILRKAKQVFPEERTFAATIYYCKSFTLL